MILERYYKFLDEKDKPKQPSKEEVERQDRLMAIRLQNELQGGMSRRGAAREKPAKVVKRKPAARRAAPNTAFNAEHVVSPQLEAVVGSARMSRPQVVKQLWVYIKAHGLQDESDKRKVLCDEKLQQVFKKLVVGMFEMNRLLGNHLYKDEDVVNQNGVKKHSESDTESLASPPVKREVKAEADLESEISDVDD